MNVTFAQFGDNIASSRLRAKIPQEELAKKGVKQGRDILVYGKHIIPMAAVKEYKKCVFDICDDHFIDDLAPYYFEHAKNADLITCNSEYMRHIILNKIGKDAVVIPEPYENKEGKPDISPIFFWYGHGSNIQDLERYLPKLKYETMILSNHPDYPEWTLDNFKEAISIPCIVIIPTGKSMAKSENRMVESVRCGRYVCAEYLPAYEPFREFFPLGNIQENADLALSNKARSIEAIKAAQEYIKINYSPQVIADKWHNVLETIWQ